MRLSEIVSHVAAALCSTHRSPLHVPGCRVGSDECTSRRSHLPLPAWTVPLHARTHCFRARHKAPHVASALSPRRRHHRVAPRRPQLSAVVNLRWWPWVGACMAWVVTAAVVTTARGAALSARLVAAVGVHGHHGGTRVVTRCFVVSWGSMARQQVLAPPSWSRHWRPKRPHTKPHALPLPLLLPLPLSLRPR